MLDVSDERAYTLTNSWIACYKILIYELTNSWIAYFRTGIYGLINSWVVCYKAILWLLNFIISRIKHWPLSHIFSYFSIPSNQHSVSRQAHPLLRRGLGRLPLHGLASHSYPSVSSHIPSFGGAWGGPFFVNFFPSCFPIYALLHSKRCPFAM